MSITSDANTAFDDYVLSSNPASGVLKPDKALIRALFADIDAAIAAVIPIGSMWPFAHDTAPAGFLICNGAEVLRSAYPKLWTFASTSAILAADGADKAANPGKFGRGDGTTTFELPKIEDFVRGTSSGRGAGTFQADAFQGHSFTLPANQADGSGTSKVADSDGTGTDKSPSAGAPVSDGSNGTPRTANETRPKNTAYPWIIKV